MPAGAARYHQTQALISVVITVAMTVDLMTGRHSTRVVDNVACAEPGGRVLIQVQAINHITTLSRLFSRILSSLFKLLILVPTFVLSLLQIVSITFVPVLTEHQTLACFAHNCITIKMKVSQSLLATFGLLSLASAADKRWANGTVWTTEVCSIESLQVENYIDLASDRHGIHHLLPLRYHFCG